MKRTLTQNASVHRYCELLAQGLNDAGYSVQVTITSPIDHTKETVKEKMFKVVMNAMFPDIKSTTKLDTKQISQVYENLNRLTGERFGVSIPWPTRSDG